MEKLQYIKLADEAFHKVYLTNVEREFESELEQENYLDQRNELIDLIEEKLSKKFGDGSWEISGDINYHDEVCGGIYQSALISESFISSITSAYTELGLKTWTYHTVCELGDGTDSEFFIRDGIVFIPNSMPFPKRKSIGYIERCSVIDALGYVCLIVIGFAGTKFQLNNTSLKLTIALSVFIIFAFTINHHKHLYNALGGIALLTYFTIISFLNSFENTSPIYYIFGLIILFNIFSDFKKFMTKKIVLSQKDLVYSKL